MERVASLGYRAAEYRGPRERSDAERKDLLLRLGVAAFLWMNVMIVQPGGLRQLLRARHRQLRAVHLHFVLMALATPAVFYCAAAGAADRLGRRAPSGVLRMETLLALGILSAYGYSVASSIRGDRHVYFDTVCAIVTLVLAGKAIERAAKDKTTRAITLLYRLMPNKARVIAESGERFVSLDALKPGTVFRVKSGERIPADGVVREGRSHTDESVLTGESAPRTERTRR